MNAQGFAPTNRLPIAKPGLWNPRPISTTGRVFADAQLNPQQDFIAFRPYGYNPPRGYGLDLNNDGKFDPKKDGFLAFDLNRDGKHTDQEIAQSRNILKAFSGDFDVNADGRVDYGEYYQGVSNFFQARSMDLDRDGVLSNWELQKAGGSVVRQNDQKNYPVGNAIGVDYTPPKWNSYSLDKLPNGSRLDYLNPWNGTFTSSSRRFYPQPLPPITTVNW